MRIFTPPTWPKQALVLAMLFTATFALAGRAVGQDLFIVEEPVQQEARAADEADEAQEEEATGEDIPQEVIEDAAKAPEANLARAVGEAVANVLNLLAPRRSVRVIPAARAEPVLDLADDEDFDELDDQTKQLIKQFQPQYEHICREELRFVHAVCHLKRSQFQKLEEAARLTMRQALIGTAEVQAQMQRGWNGPQPPKYPDVRKWLEDALLSAVKRECSADQAALYEDELQARRDFRREACIELIAASLDRELVMTPRQREQILEVLGEAWRKDWQQSTHLLISGNNYFPVLPDGKIQKLLNARQSSHFNGLQKGANHFAGHPWGIFGVPHQGHRGGPLEEELEFAPEEDAP